MLTEFCSKENEMLSYPKIGDKVMIRYGKKWAQYTPYPMCCGQLMKIVPYAPPPERESER